MSDLTYEQLDRRVVAARDRFLSTLHQLDARTRELAQRAADNARATGLALLSAAAVSIALSLGERAHRRAERGREPALPGAVRLGMVAFAFVAVRQFALHELQSHTSTRRAGLPQLRRLATRALETWRASANKNDAPAGMPHALPSPSSSAFVERANHE